MEPDHRRPARKKRPLEHELNNGHQPEQAWQYLDKSFQGWSRRAEISGKHSKAYSNHQPEQIGLVGSICWQGNDV